MKLFIVGAQVKEILDATKPDKPLVDSIWDMLGVFDNKEAAMAACTQRHHFVGPIELNQRLPDERGVWPGCWYPHLQEEPTA